MTRNSFRQRLQAKFESAARDGEAMGIDLGTTKSCIAIARYDADTEELNCECVGIEDDGKTRIAVPSAVALEQNRVLVGVRALEKRGQPGFLPERCFFYETKNTIGLKYSYANARPGFANATDIAAHVLHHLYECVEDEHGWIPEGPLVVGCPASFHAAQRDATVIAASVALEAGFPLGADEMSEVDPTRTCLIDEPYAVFLDMLFREPGGSGKLLVPGNTLMVFDFGGGTCDVAIFRMDVNGTDPIGAGLLATSRYHRLGGGDIDRAIVHEVLIPQLLEENGIGRFDVSWFDKSRRLEPALIGAAEELKIQMSHVLSGNHASLTVRAPKGAAAGNEEVALPAMHLEVEISGVKRELTLKRPTLTKEAFNRVLKAFLDPEPAPESGDEYVQRSSIFLPITQALLRAGLEPDDLDGVLMCGCSSRLPPVQDAILAHFPNAACVLMGVTEEELQGCVARGAALQALARDVFERNLIEPVCSAELSLQVTVGTVPLVKPGDTLPAHSIGSIALHPPRDSLDEDLDLSVEVVADGKTLVGRTLWHLPAPVKQSDPLSLEWTLNENQCLELNLQRSDALFDAPLIKRFDSPIAHCDMSQVVRARMLERMERMRSGDTARADIASESEKIARDAATLGEYERALHFVSVALQERGDSPGLLNLRGIYRQNIGDKEGALDAYQNAAREHTGARFNLGLLHYNAGRYAEALTAVNAAIEGEPSRAYKVLRGDILDKIGRHDEARQEWQDAIAGNINFDVLEEFDLGWLSSCANRMNNQAVRDKIRLARERKAQRLAKGSRQGELPVFVGRAVCDVADLL